MRGGLVGELLVNMLMPREGPVAAELFDYAAVRLDLGRQCLVGSTIDSFLFDVR